MFTVFPAALTPFDYGHASLPNIAVATFCAQGDRELHGLQALTRHSSRGPSTPGETYTRIPKARGLIIPDENAYKTKVLEGYILRYNHTNT